MSPSVDGGVLASKPKTHDSAKIGLPENTVYLATHIWCKVINVCTAGNITSTI